MATAYRCRKCGAAFSNEQPANVVLPQLVTDVFCPNCKALQDDDDRSKVVEPAKGRFATQGREIGVYIDKRN